MSSASGTMIIWYSPLRGAGWRELLPAAVPRRHYENFCAAVPVWHCYYFHPHTFDWLLFLPSCFRQSGPNFETCNNPWSCSVVTFWLDIFFFFCKMLHKHKNCPLFCFPFAFSSLGGVTSSVQRCSSWGHMAGFLCSVFYMQDPPIPLFGFTVAPWPWNFLKNIIIQLRYKCHS